MVSSILSIVVLSLAQGTSYFPYLFYKNGSLIAALIITFAGFISACSGFWIARVASATQARRFEDMALKTYGSKCSTFTSIIILLTLMSFTIGMIVIVSFNFAERFSSKICFQWLFKPFLQTHYHHGLLILLQDKNSGH